VQSLQWPLIKQRPCTIWWRNGLPYQKGQLGPIRRIFAHDGSTDAIAVTSMVGHCVVQAEPIGCCSAATMQPMPQLPILIAIVQRSGDTAALPIVICDAVRVTMTIYTPLTFC